MSFGYVLVLGIFVLFCPECTSDNKTGTSHFCENENGERYCCIGQYLLNSECVDCPPGTLGTNCSDTCPEGYYGVHCVEICNCTVNETCNHSIGCIPTQITRNTTRLWLAPIVVVIVTSIVMVLCWHFICQPQTTYSNDMKGGSAEFLPTDHQPVPGESLENESPYDDVRTSQMLPGSTSISHTENHSNEHASSKYEQTKMITANEIDEYNVLSLRGSKIGQSSGKYDHMDMLFSMIKK